MADPFYDTTVSLEEDATFNTIYTVNDQDGFWDASFEFGYEQGVYAGSKIINTGIGLGLQRGFSKGYEDGGDDGRAQGLQRGTSIGITIAVSDLNPPTVTITSLPTTDEDPAVVQVYDSNNLRFIQLTCQDRTDGPKMIVYDDTGFQHPFNGKSTVTGTGTSSDPYIFTIYRRGRWPTGISLDFKARAIDVAGNQRIA